MREDLIPMAHLIPMVAPCPWWTSQFAHMIEPIPLVNPIHISWTSL